MPEFSPFRDISLFVVASAMMLGRIAKTISLLRPQGKVVIDGEAFSVLVVEHSSYDRRAEKLSANPKGHQLDLWIKSIRPFGVSCQVNVN